MNEKFVLMLVSAIEGAGWLIVSAILLATACLTSWPVALIPVTLFIFSIRWLYKAQSRREREIASAASVASTGSDPTNAP